MLVCTSKGEFPLTSKRGNIYEVNAINDCAEGYFILKEDGTREYFASVSDEMVISRAFSLINALSGIPFFSFNKS